MWGRTLFFFVQNSLFDLFTRCTRFHHKFPWFFNDSESRILIFKIHLETLPFFCRSRGRFTVMYGATCRTSAAVLTKKIVAKFTSIYQPRNARVFTCTGHFFSLKKKVLVAPAPLTILTKHIVFPQCRCWCEMCRMSAVLLRVFRETAYKSS